MEAGGPCRTCAAGILGPNGLVKTGPHAASLLLGMGACACFGVSLALQRPFDATLAALLMMLCVHVFSLQTQRLQLDLRLAKQVKQPLTAGAQDLRNEVLPAQPAAEVPAAPPSEDMDLPSYAQALGVGGSGFGLGQILMTSLAKEYLRCVSALQSYKALYGNLEAAPPMPPQPLPSSSSAGQATSERSAGGAYSVDVTNEKVETCPQGLGSAYDIRQQPHLAAPPLKLDFQAQDLSSQRATTPRSPRGPPSPEQQQRRRSFGNTVEVSPEPQRYVGDLSV
eukprot:TRINITY_DN6240_c0_g1_i1.p1 TRINITY_DN6240_c0_g1~~TRINITY_DN6240_c0_g1_i1.p1  ORF type:complete len:298 (-),score=58.02 TRINITY_DN6240_c0_g1_i1:243-1085(-)